MSSRRLNITGSPILGATLFACSMLAYLSTFTPGGMVPRSLVAASALAFLVLAYESWARITTERARVCWGFAAAITFVALADVVIGSGWLVEYKQKPAFLYNWF